MRKPLLSLVAVLGLGCFAVVSLEAPHASSTLLAVATSISQVVRRRKPISKLVLIFFHLFLLVT